MGRDDFMNAVLRDNVFVVSPQSTVLEVLLLVVLELQCGWVEKVLKTPGSCR